MPPSQLQTPTILENVRLHGLLQWLVARHSSSTMVVVCSTPAEFDVLLVKEAQRIPEWILHPTLQILNTTQAIDFSFCPSVSALHALLLKHASSTLRLPVQDQAPSLVVVNPLRLHEKAPFYSAQGLSRFFAAAVTASVKSGSELFIAECVPESSESCLTNGSPEADYTVSVSDDEGVAADSIPERDPWSAQIPILNTATRSFGPGERGWVGRTVDIRQVASAWYLFKPLEN